MGVPSKMSGNNTNASLIFMSVAPVRKAAEEFAQGFSGPSLKERWCIKNAHRDSQGGILQLSYDGCEQSRKGQGWGNGFNSPPTALRIPPETRYNFQIWPSR